MSYGLSVLARWCAAESCAIGLAQWALLEPAVCERSDARVSVDFGDSRHTEVEFDAFSDVYVSTRRLFPDLSEDDVKRLSEGLFERAQQQIAESVKQDAEIYAVVDWRGERMAMGYSSRVCWFTVEWSGTFEIETCVEKIALTRACDQIAQLLSANEGAAWWDHLGLVRTTTVRDELVVCPSWPHFGCKAQTDGEVPAVVDALALAIHNRQADENQSSPATHPNDRGVEDVLCPSHPLVSLAVKANKYAVGLDDFEDPGANSLDSTTHMTARSNRRLLNYLCKHNPNGTRYLEIGALKGSSLAACLDGNKASVRHAHSVDSFVEFDGGPDAVHRAAQPHDVPYTLHQTDFRDPSLIASLRDINVYLYDGPHSHQDHADAFLLYKDVFAPTFLAVVDDWNFPQVRSGTEHALSLLNYTVLYQRRVIHHTDDRSFWHNGIAFFVLTTQEPSCEP